jgi:hypothetical protein
MTLCIDLYSTIRYLRDNMADTQTPDQGVDKVFSPDYQQHAYSNLPPALKRAVKEAVKSGLELSGPENELFGNLVLGAALGAAKQNLHALGMLPPGYHSNGPVTNESPYWVARWHNLDFGWRQGREALRQHPQSPSAAFKQGMLAINGAMPDEYGKRLQLGTSKQGPVGYFSSFDAEYLTNPSKGVADAVARAAGQPTPRRRHDQPLPTPAKQRANLLLKQAQPNAQLNQAIRTG